MIEHKNKFVRLTMKAPHPSKDICWWYGKMDDNNIDKNFASTLLIEWLRKTTHPNEAVASFTEHTHLVGNLGDEI